MTETADLNISTTTQHLGWSVGISGKQIVVGSFNGPYSASPLFLYAEPESGWQSTSTPALMLQQGPPSAEFGFSTAISDDVLIVGAPYQTVRGTGGEGVVFGFELTAR